jgi:hypothetical protein
MYSHLKTIKTFTTSSLWADIGAVLALVSSPITLVVLDYAMVNVITAMTTTRKKGRGEAWKMPPSR